MVEISPAFYTVINLAAFGAFVAIGGVMLYVGRTTHPEKKISFPWINLANGTFLIAVNYLIQAIFAPQTPIDSSVEISSYLLIVGGSALLFTSFVILYTERANETNVLKQRQDDLKEITTRLKKKYLSRELPEDELKKLDTDIVRELAEIEVKLDKINRKPKAKP